MFHVLASACASCQRGHSGTAGFGKDWMSKLCSRPCKDAEEAEDVSEVRFRLSRGLEANLPEEEIRKPLSHRRDVTTHSSFS